MGGEKLKLSRPCLGFFLATLFILAGFSGFISPPSLSAQESDVDLSTMFQGETSVGPVADGGSSVFVVLRMVLVLALAALAIYGVVFFIKRLARPQENPDPHLRVLARIPLSSDSFAAVLSVGAKAWLVGGGSGGINLISEIDDVESLETMLIEDAEKIAQASNRRIFNFRSLLGKLGVPARENPRTANGSFAANGSRIESGFLTESLREQRERLREQ